MKTIQLLITLLLLTGLLAQPVHGVNISRNGTGEALIYPYYTVRNDFNAVYSIVNTTAQAKALKVRFHSGDLGSLMLGFNVYLAPYDVWTGVLTPTSSTVPDYIGQPTVLHQTNDQSCAPFVVKAGQQFLPFALPPGDSLELGTEGYLEVIEMGQLTGPSLAAVEHLGDGIPSSCATISGAWDTNGYWQLDPTVDMTPPGGGLTGSMSLINLPAGLSAAYEALALVSFWQSAGLHTSPANIFPNLENAAPQSTLVTDQGLVSLQWPTGYQAVSAALMSQSLISHYNLSEFLTARTEWVINFPTKRHHTDSEFAITQPFSGYGDDICEPAQVEVFDSHSQNLPLAPINLCHTVGVVEFLNPDQTPGPTSGIVDSWHGQVVPGFNQSGSHNGWARLTAGYAGQAMTNTSGKVLLGLPMVGFQLTTFTNFNAAPNVLSQYASLIPFSHQRVSTDDLIFANGVD